MEKEILNNETTNKKGRDSNFELFRIIIMLLIVAHHYIVHSGLEDFMLSNPLSTKTFIFFIAGAYGKTAINCFVLITGYFMCTSNITSKKFFKLFFEVMFYKVVIYLIFVLTNKVSFSPSLLLESFLPIYKVGDDQFVDCFLVFYLLIPFINILIKNIDEKKHLMLLGVLLFIYVVLYNVPKVGVIYNYVSWFIVIYLIASYIRLYPKKIFNNLSFWLISSVVMILISFAAVILGVTKSYKVDINYSYTYVTDANSLIALLLGLSLFMLFKNINMKENRFINLIASATFGVLLIHFNSDAMKEFLWVDLLKNVEFFNTNYAFIHILLSVLGVYIVCVIIDLIRQVTIEKPFINFIDSKWNQLVKKITKKESN